MLPQTVIPRNNLLCLNNTNWLHTPSTSTLFAYLATNLTCSLLLLDAWLTVTHGCLGFLQKPTVQACISFAQVQYQPPGGGGWWWLILDLGKIHACTVGFCKNPRHPCSNSMLAHDNGYVGLETMKERYFIGRS